MTLPTQTQLMLPLLEAIQENGGEARPRELYDQVAESVGLSRENREAGSSRNNKTNAFERRLRWTRQTAIAKGLIAGKSRAVWSLTERGRDRLKNVARGTVLTFAISESAILLWASAEDAWKEIEPGSVDLLLTSPPYPLTRPKEYGNVSPERWVGWMLELCASWRALLHPAGSMMLNIGPCWHKGLSAQQLHVERLLVKLEDELGIRLLQRLDWHSPTKMPTPLTWVGIRRLRVTPSVEPLLWVSPNPYAKGNNRNVLRPYSRGGLREIRAPRLASRPSGRKFGVGSFQDCGGSILPSLISATPAGIEEIRYRNASLLACKKPHPAVLPAMVARFGIALATDPGDTVYDPMAGSGTVAVEAVKLGRKALASERSFAYLENMLARFDSEHLEAPRRIVSATASFCERECSSANPSQGIIA